MSVTKKDRLNHELKWNRKAMEYVNEQPEDGIEEVNAKVYARKAIGECIERLEKKIKDLELKGLE